VWVTKVFKTKLARDKWLAKNQARYQVVEVFVNNAYALDVRKLRQIGG
jgi:hypothetical protein